MVTKKDKEGGTYAGHSFYYTNPNCGRKDYFSKVCRLESTEPRLPLLKGTILHKAFAEYYKAGLDRTTLFATFEQELAKNPSLKDEYTNLEKMLHVWYDRWHEEDLKFKILAVEEPMDCSFKYGGKTYVYSIKADLIVKDPSIGSTLLIDHKCTWSSLPRTQTTGENSDQATLYLHGVTQHGYNPEGFLLDLLYQKGNVVKAERYAPIYRTQTETIMCLKAFARKIDRLNEAMEHVEKGEDPLYWFPREGGYSCSFTCEYQDICRQNITPDYLPQGYRRVEQ